MILTSLGIVILAVGAIVNGPPQTEQENEDRSDGPDYDPMDYRGLDSPSKRSTISSIHQTKLSDYE